MTDRAQPRPARGPCAPPEAGSHKNGGPGAATVTPGQGAHRDIVVQCMVSMRVTYLVNPSSVRNRLPGRSLRAAAGDFWVGDPGASRGFPGPPKGQRLAPSAEDPMHAMHAVTC